MHIAILHVDPALLVAALHLPEGTTLHGVNVDFNTLGGRLLLKVEHPSLPLAQPGMHLPVVNCIVTRDPLHGGFVSSRYE